MPLLQIQPIPDAGWRKRRMRQIAHSIPHYFAELRDIHSAREGLDWLYFKKPYLFPLRKFPPRATVEFTNQCNFSCGYCPRSVMSRSVGHMDVNVFVALARELEQGGCSVMKIAGLGEPVIHPEFAKLMESLRDSRMKVFLYTNGSLFIDRLPEEICTWNINTIVLSVDGLTPSAFEKQRKGGNYTAMRGAAERFAKHQAKRKPILEIRHIILPNESNDDLKVFRKDWLQIGDTVKFNYLIPLQPQGASVPRDVPCRDIRREAYVRWDGRLLLCAGQERQQTPEWLGDNTVNSIADLWMDARLQDLRAAHDGRRPDLPDCCQKCAFR